MTWPRGGLQRHKDSIYSIVELGSAFPTGVKNRSRSSTYGQSAQICHTHLYNAVCASGVRKGSTPDHAGACPISEDDVVARANHKEISTATTE